MPPGTRNSRASQATVAPTVSLLKQQAYLTLKMLIQDGVLAPGDFLSERQLALRLGMSKTPVKAALERLEAEGFISVSPQQGIVVRELSIHEVSDQFEIRLALETLVARSLAGRLTEEQGKQLRRLLSTHERAAARHDVKKCVEIDTQFHILLCRFHGNREIERVMVQLRDRMHRAITHVLRLDVGRLTTSHAEHLAIVDALLDNNPNVADQRVREHLEYGRQSLLTPRRL